MHLSEFSVCPFIFYDGIARECTVFILIKVFATIRFAWLSTVYRGE